MSKEKLKTKKGITLVALVITIVIMLILVATTVTVALNGGLFKLSKQATKDTQIATVREMVNTDVLAKRGNKKGRNLTAEELGLILEKYCDGMPSLEDLEDEELGKLELKLKKEYGGCDTTLKELYDGQIQLAEWEEQKDEEGNITITKGKQTLNIGDYVGYKTKESPGTKWRVLGAEDGKILLMADSNVGSSVSLRGSEWGEDGQGLVDKLNQECQQYLNEEYAESIRSIKVEDINKITGYNPLYTGKKNPTQEDIQSDTEHIHRYNSGQIDEYGNKVKYTWRTLYDSSKNVVSDDTESGYGKNKRVDSSKSKFVMPPDNKELVDEGLTVESTVYQYYPYTLSKSSSTSDNAVGIKTTSPAYKMIFEDSNGVKTSYWLASPCVKAETGFVKYGLFQVHSSGLAIIMTLWESHIGSYSPSLYTRPVVTLKSNVKLTKDDSVAEQNGSVTYKISD